MLTVFFNIFFDKARLPNATNGFKVCVMLRVFLKKEIGL